MPFRTTRNKSTKWQSILAFRMSSTTLRKTTRCWQRTKSSLVDTHTFLTNGQRPGLLFSTRVCISVHCYGSFIQKSHPGRKSAGKEHTQEVTGVSPDSQRAHEDWPRELDRVTPSSPAIGQGRGAASGPPRTGGASPGAAGTPRSSRGRWTPC